MSKRVFVVEPTKHDVSRAAEHGVLTYVFPRGTRRSSVWSDDFREEVLEGMARLDFDPRSDRVLMAGHTVVMMIVASLLAALHGAFTGLCYDAATGAYVETRMGQKKAQQASQEAQPHV